MQIATSQKTVRYKVPLLQREAIGSKPAHRFDQNPKAETPYISLPDPSKGGDHTVWATQPVYSEAGEVQFKEVAKTVDLTPRNPLTRGLGYGALAAVPGAIGGLLLSETLGLTACAGALLGAAVIGGSVGLATGAQVYGEKTALAWDTHKIYQHEMKGYHELVGLGEKNGERGFFHRFMPDVKSDVVGEYQTPKVIRYKGEKPEDEGGLVSREWPGVILKKEPEVPNRKVDVTVSFEDSALRRRHLGRMPSDHWDYSSWSEGYRECGPGGCNTGGQSVVRSTPIYEPNNEPRVEAIERRLTEEASSIAGTAIV